MASPDSQNHHTYTPASTLSTRALLNIPAPARTESSLSSVSAVLTPNTRTEAEAALSYNSSQQTDSAAPTSSFSTSGAGDGMMDGAPDRPGLPMRTSSHHYADAVDAATTSPEGEDGVVGVGYAAEGTERYVSGRSGVESQPWRPTAGRQPSYSKEDMRRLMQERLMKEHPVDMGYQSGSEKE